MIKASLASSAASTLGILLLDLLQESLKVKGRILDLGGIGHDSILHGGIDELNLVETVHRCCTKNLIVRFTDIVSHEFHFSKITDDVDIIPSFSDSSKDKRVIELPSPEERNIINWEFLARNIQGSN